MNYTLDRFMPKAQDSETRVPDGELSSGLKNAVGLSTWAGGLTRILDKLDKKKEVGEQAKKSIVMLLETANSIGEEVESPDLMGKLLTKMLKFIGKKIFKAIVRPILQFAARMAMNIMRIAARTLLRFVILPVIELVSTALLTVLASPVGWVALGGAALLGGGYYLWKKWRTPVTVEVGDTQATGAVVGDIAAPEVTAPEVPRTRFERLTEAVRQSAPVQAIESAVERPRVFVARRGARFQGFGEDVDGYIRETAARYPILPEDVLRGFIKMEAGWTGAMSPTGAIGTGQFTGGIWNRLISRFGGASIGMTPITGFYAEERDARGRPIRPHIKPNPNGNFRTPEDPRFNKRVNTLATGLLASLNAETLRRNGLPITGANLYMMHNIGDGIIPVMKGQAASASTLTAMRQNGMTGSVRTPEDFLAMQKARYETAYSEANTTTSVVGNDARMADGVVVDKPRSNAPSAIATQGRRGSTSAPVSGTQTDLIRGPNNAIVRM